MSKYLFLKKKKSKTIQKKTSKTKSQKYEQ